MPNSDLSLIVSVVSPVGMAVPAGQRIMILGMGGQREPRRGELKAQCWGLDKDMKRFPRHVPQHKHFLIAVLL